MKRFYTSDEIYTLFFRVIHLGDPIYVVKMYITSIVFAMIFNTNLNFSYVTLNIAIKDIFE